MNITFMIGNGFDLGLGIHSRFMDFFPQYVEQSKSKKEEIRMLSERIGSDYQTWSDFETQMGQYTKEFTSENKDLYSRQFRDFEIEFIKFLKNEEQQISFDDKEKISKMMISGLTNFYKGNILRVVSSQTISQVFSSNNHQSHCYQFISFNYTDALEKCISTIPDGIVNKHPFNGGTLPDKIGKIVHVHGTSDNAPIMGVNDVSQIANEELAHDEQFIRYVVKPKLNFLHRTNHDSDGANLIASSQIICIYGMALGATDKCWWVRILEWLNGGANRQLVIFDYDPDFNNSSQFDWIDKEDSLIEKLSGYVDDLEIDIEKLRSRIHIAVHKNIFQLDIRKKLNALIKIRAEDIFKKNDTLSPALELLNDNPQLLEQPVLTSMK